VANEENLKPFTSDQSREEAKINGSKGGKASGESRRRKKAMRQAAATLLNMDISKANGDGVNKIKQHMKAFGYDIEDATMQDAMLVRALIKGLSGDIRALEFLRDTAGANPALDIRKEELKLKKAELKLKREALLDSSKPERDDNNLLDAIKAVEEIETNDLPEVE